MFNLKRKVNQVAQNVNQSFEPVRNPQEVIAEIHNEFDTVTDKLLTEAKEILAGIKDVGKGERLKALGFCYSKPAVEAESEIKKRDRNIQVAKCADHFSASYPNNKFITDEKVAEICKKYRLVFGPAFWYAGDVPEKNIKEIENFNLKEDDFTTTPVMEYTAENQQLVRYRYTERVDGTRDHIYVTDPSITEVKEKLPLKICAPISDFEPQYIRDCVKVIDGYQLVAKDPIVLQPVNGGYLIISKWGLEASDESLVNEKMN